MLSLGFSFVHLCHLSTFITYFAVIFINDFPLPVADKKVSMAIFPALPCILLAPALINPTNLFMFHHGIQ